MDSSAGLLLYCCTLRHNMYAGVIYLSDGISYRNAYSCSGHMYEVPGMYHTYGLRILGTVVMPACYAETQRAAGKVCAVQYARPNTLCADLLDNGEGANS